MTMAIAMLVMTMTTTTCGRTMVEHNDEMSGATVMVWSLVRGNVITMVMTTTMTMATHTDDTKMTWADDG